MYSRLLVRACGCAVDHVCVERDCGCDAKPFMYCVAGAGGCDRVPGRAWGCDANPFMYCVAGAERCDCAVEREAGTPGFARPSARSSFAGFGLTGVVPDASCVSPRAGFCVEGRAPDGPLSWPLREPASSDEASDLPPAFAPVDAFDVPAVVTGFAPADFVGLAGFAGAAFVGFADAAGLPDLG